MVSQRHRQTPQTPVCTRMLWTASVAFAKRTALHASTLSLLVGLVILQRSVLPGVNGIGIHTEYYLGHIQPSRGVIQQIRLCHKNAVSCLHLQSIQQHHRGSHICGVYMKDDTPFRPCLGARHIVELAQTLVTPSSSRKLALVPMNFSPFSLYSDAVCNNNQV